MATLGLKEMGKFLWEGKEKGLPSCLSQFSKTRLRQPTGQTFFLSFPKEFPISFKPKVAIENFIRKIQKKIWYQENWVGRHASFPPRRSVKINYHNCCPNSLVDSKRNQFGLGVFHLTREQILNLESSRRAFPAKKKTISK